MRISEALNDISLLYIETAPFIYYTESRAGYVDKMRLVFDYVARRELRAITAALSLTETLMKPLQMGDMNLINAYRALFYRTDGLVTLSITPQDGDLAAILRANYTLKTPDALHLAVAIANGCEAFLTNDLALRRVQEIKVLSLEDLEA